MGDDRDHGGGPPPAMPGGCGRRPSGRRPDRGREPPSQTCRHPEIFVRYRATGTTVRVSADSIGGHSNDQHRPRHQWRRQPRGVLHPRLHRGAGRHHHLQQRPGELHRPPGPPAPRYLHPQQPAAHPKA